VKFDNKWQGGRIVMLLLFVGNDAREENWVYRSAARVMPLTSWGYALAIAMM
jgi:hypothetical protein